jgi:hypothetical protein
MRRLLIALLLRPGASATRMRPADGDAPARKPAKGAACSRA